jgi:hypothetical protein
MLTDECHAFQFRAEKLPRSQFTYIDGIKIIDKELLPEIFGRKG